MEEYKLAEQNLGLLTAGAIGLVVAGLLIAFGSQVVSDIKGDFTANTFEANASDNTLQGMEAMADKLPSIGLIIGAVVIIGLLVAGFRGLR